MNIQRYVGRTARDAMALVRQELGDEAVLLSTKPCPEGIEVLAMGSEGLAQLERRATETARTPRPIRNLEAGMGRREPTLENGTTAPEAPTVGDDVSRLSMSTLSFQDYVRERLLKRRQETLHEDAGATPPRPAPPSVFEQRRAQQMARTRAAPAPRAAAPTVTPPPAPSPMAARAPAVRPEPPILREALSGRMPPRRSAPAVAVPDLGLSHSDAQHMLDELRSVRGLIENRFGDLAFMEKLQRHPAQAEMIQQLLDCGYSPALVRKLAQNLPENLPAQTPTALAWALSVLERNLLTGEGEPALEDQGGIYALIGSTGVGKTTTTAKIAATFAARHGATHLGLITLDAYRLGAHEQLRAYGRILGVPVHTAHDRASLEDLLDLLSSKRMVLIDTAGMGQRDARTRELLDMLGHRAIGRVLVLSASAQSETIEDVMAAYQAPQCRGLVLTKLDEAVKLAPALDPVIRHRLRLLGVANGQRVPEDWHRLSAQALVQRASRVAGGAAYRVDATDVGLLLTSRGGGHAAEAVRAAPGASAPLWGLHPRPATEGVTPPAAGV